MINRDWQEATVATLSGDEVNAWGVPTTTGETRTIEVYMKIYSQVNVLDPRYVDVDQIALTRDTSVTTSDQLTVNGKLYGVKYTIPSPRYHTLLLTFLKDVDD